MRSTPAIGSWIQRAEVATPGARRSPSRSPGSSQTSASAAASTPAGSPPPRRMARQAESLDTGPTATRGTVTRSTLPAPPGALTVRDAHAVPVGYVGVPDGTFGVQAIPAGRL